MKKCVVIYNKHSGKKNKKDFTEEFLRILSENDYESEIVFTKYKGHTIEIVESLKNDVDLVITIGGDGTFNESMRGNFKRKKRLTLAHIPVGTTNDVGKMFGYGKDTISNLKLLMDGVTKKMDICTINDEPFVYVAGFGKFMNIPYETSRKSKKKLGYFAYVINAVKNFCKFTKLREITYKINGEEYKGLFSFMLIANATRIAGVNLFNNIKLDDDKFEILFCNLRKRKDIIKTLYYLKKNDIEHVPGFFYHESNTIEISVTNEDSIPWCIDGEKIDINGTATIKIDRESSIMMPRKNIDKLFKNDSN